MVQRYKLMARRIDSLENEMKKKIWQLIGFFLNDHMNIYKKIYWCVHQSKYLMLDKQHQHQRERRNNIWSTMQSNSAVILCYMKQTDRSKRKFQVARKKCKIGWVMCWISAIIWNRLYNENGTNNGIWKADTRHCKRFYLFRRNKTIFFSFELATNYLRMSLIKQDNWQKISILLWNLFYIGALPSNDFNSQSSKQVGNKYSKTKNSFLQCLFGRSVESGYSKW